MTKTYKREVALVLLVAMTVLYLWGILGNPVALAAADSIKLPVFTFAGGAFGLDAVLKRDV